MYIVDFWEHTNSLIKEKRTTQRTLSKECGFTERRIETLVSNNRLPDALEAFLIAKKLGTTVEELLTGEPPGEISFDIFKIARKIAALSSEDRGEVMLLVHHKLGRYPETKGKAFLTNDSPPAYETDTASRRIIDISRYIDDEIPIDKVKFMGWKMTFIPVVGKTAAGEPIDINAYTDEGLPFPIPLLKGNPEEYYIVKIEGTSMTEAKIYDGDYVLIRRAEAPVNGKIMLVRYENSSTLKRIKIEKKQGKETVFLYWDDGSGDFKMVDSSEYEIQGEFFRNLGK